MRCLLLGLLVPHLAFSQAFMCPSDHASRRRSGLACGAYETYICGYAPSSRRRDYGGEAADTCRSTCAVSYGCTVPSCTVTDGSAVSSTYACTCGNAICATGQKCTRSLSRCEADIGCTVERSNDFTYWGTSDLLGGLKRYSEPSVNTLPRGPWLSSARDASLSGSRVCAELRRLDGSWAPRDCVVVDAMPVYENIDGIGSPAEIFPEFRNNNGKFDLVVPPALPLGDWRETAKDVTLETGMLCATLRRVDLTWRRSCAAFKDGQSLYNHDGSFQLDTCPMKSRCTGAKWPLPAPEEGLFYPQFQNWSLKYYDTGEPEPPPTEREIHDKEEYDYLCSLSFDGNTCPTPGNLINMWNDIRAHFKQRLTELVADLTQCYWDEMKRYRFNQRP